LAAVLTAFAAEFRPLPTAVVAVDRPFPTVFAALLMPLETVLMVLLSQSAEDGTGAARSVTAKNKAHVFLCITPVIGCAPWCMALFTYRARQMQSWLQLQLLYA
jgi:hypothetical protein